MEEGERYAAFISYRHLPLDRRWASWLIDQLERFRTPSALVKQGFRSRLGRVFRDEDEIPASSNLSSQIEQALGRSDALIVVASRDTPKSRWIDREVSYFQKQGMGDRIFVLLVDGEPENAFPASLLQGDREPIAADVRPRQDASPSRLRTMARLRLIAALLGCPYDDLRRREAQRQRRTIIVGALISTTLLAAVAGVTVQSLRRQFTLDLTASMTAEQPSSGAMTPAQRAFHILPADNPLLAETPDVVKDALRPLARRGALKLVTPYNQGGSYYGPTRFAPRDTTSQLVGWFDGSVTSVEVGGRVTRLLSGGCPSNNFDFFHRCAVTALAYMGGDDLVAGNFSGFLRIAQNGQTRWVKLSDNRVAHVVSEGSGAIVAADGGGNLYRVFADGRIQTLQADGGAVATLRSRGSYVEIVRRRGVIERLQGNRITQEASLPEIFLGAAQSGQQRIFLTSIIVEDSAELQRRARVEVRRLGSDYFVDLTTENYGSGSVGGMEILDSDGSQAIIVGQGLKLYKVYLQEQRADLIDILSREQLRAPSAEFDYLDYSPEMPRYFDVTIGSSGGGQFIYTIDSGALVIVDLDLITKIDQVIDNSYNLKRDLCLLGLGPIFATSSSNDACRTP